MTKFLLSFILIFNVILTVPVFAQDKPTKNELIDKHIEFTRQSMNIPQIAKVSAGPMLDAVFRQAPDLSDAKKQRLTIRVELFIEDALSDSVESTRDIIDDTYSYDELSALTQFYSSEIGARALRKMPGLMQKTQPIVLDAIQNNTGELQKVIIQELERSE